MRVWAVNSNIKGGICLKKKKRRKKRVWRLIGTVFLTLLILAAIVLLLFRTRSFEVEGNSYYGENTITTWIQQDRFSVNTLYILAKYNLTEPDLPSGVDSMKVSLKNPWTIHVTVTEKEMAGYVNYNDYYLYFDRTGTAVLRSKKLIEGVPYIEGLSFDASKVVLGETLPVEDDSIFEKIVDVSRNLKKYNLTPDRITCADGDIQLYFGVVEVLLGSGNYEDKLEQAEVILAKLTELYPDTAGTLHLENYNSESESIRFVPSQ